MAEAQTPLVLLRNLPVWSGALSETDTVLCVLGNRNAVRAPMTAVTGNSVQFAENAPSSPSSSGQPAQIAADSTGLYYYYEGAWKKLPAVTENWDEYTGDTQFVIANKSQNFTPEQVNNIRTSLQLGAASTENAGLVKLTSGMDSNDGGVPTAEQVKQYIEEKLKDIVISGGDGGGGGTATINLADYTGNVCLKGPNGETILCYDASSKKLYFGVGVQAIETQVTDAMNFLGPNGEVVSSIGN